MKLPPLATNTTNTNWIPPPPPKQLQFHAGWSDCLFARFVCLPFLSVYLSSVHPPPWFCLCLLQKKKKITHYYIQCQFSIQICSLEHSNKNGPKWATNERDVLSTGETDRLSMGCLFQPDWGIAFTPWVTSTCIYPICTCSQCQVVLWPLCPQSSLLECC